MPKNKNSHRGPDALSDQDAQNNRDTLKRAAAVFLASALLTASAVEIGKHSRLMNPRLVRRTHVVQVPGNRTPDEIDDKVVTTESRG